MRPILFILLLTATASFGQEPEPQPMPTPSPVGSGPGIALPEHSQPQPIDLTHLQSRSIELADRIKEPAMELFTFLALLALIFAAYKAQFQGMSGLINPVIMLVITSSLILHYKDLIPIILDARTQFKAALSENDFIFTKQLSASMASMATTVGIMSISGIAAGVGLFFVILAAGLIYLTQLLFESVLITLGPLAIATLAFPQTRGIFTFWFKTWIAVLLIPVGWTLGAKFVGETFVAQDFETTSFLVAILSILSYGAVFLGMPIITTMIVNASGGVAAAGMPSFLNMATNLMGGIPAMGKLGSFFGGSGSSSTSSHSTGQTQSTGSSSVKVASSSLSPTNVATPSSDPISVRAIQAQQWHKQIQSNSKPT